MEPGMLPKSSKKRPKINKKRLRENIEKISKNPPNMAILGPQKGPVGVGNPGVERLFGDLVLGTSAGVPPGRHLAHFWHPLGSIWCVLDTLWPPFGSFWLHLGSFRYLSGYIPAIFAYVSMGEFCTDMEPISIVLSTSVMLFFCFLCITFHPKRQK